MTEIRGLLRTDSHPDSHGPGWALTPEAREKLARDVVGKTVTVNYDPNVPIGRVVAASCDGNAVSISVDIGESNTLTRLAALAPPDAYSFGPGLTFIAADLPEDGARLVRDFHLDAVSLLLDRWRNP